MFSTASCLESDNGVSTSNTGGRRQAPRPTSPYTSNQVGMWLRMYQVQYIWNTFLIIFFSGEINPKVWVTVSWIYWWQLLTTSSDTILKLVNYRGKTKVIGKRYVTVINRNYQYHPNRYQANHVLPFPSNWLPRTSCYPIPIQTMTVQISAFLWFLVTIQPNTAQTYSYQLPYSNVNELPWSCLLYTSPSPRD